MHSGPLIADALANFFLEKQSNDKPTKRSIRYYVTDLPHRFQKLGSKFLEDTIEKVDLIEID